MNEDAIRAQLTIIRQSCDTIDSLLAPSVIFVKPGDNLLSILETAPAGSVISIDPAFTITADITISKPVTLMSTILSTVGVRVDEAFRCPDLIGAMTVAAPNVTFINISLIGANPDQAILSTFDNFISDRCIVMGNTLGQHRGILANNTKNAAIRDSWIGNIFGSIDTQAIVAWDGLDGLTVDNCYLEASGENILFGGEDASSLANIPKKDRKSVV